jgi:hypothetical protein
VARTGPAFDPGLTLAGDQRKVPEPAARVTAAPAGGVSFPFDVATGTTLSPNANRQPDGALTAESRSARLETLLVS